MIDFFLFEFILIVSSFLSTNVADADAGLFGNLETVSFDEGYAPLFADFNIRRSSDNRSASLLLNRHAGSGFISSRHYDYGFFSAKIKLPGSYTAGVVVAFYMSNVDVYEKEHDELDIEFLGNVQGKEWRFQTNVYGNGSTKRGREERYNLWFDPTAGFHRYSILWSSKRIIFYVDEVPVRELVRTPAMGGDYPTKPMSVYATIWDASSWATSGGQYRVRYDQEPFIAAFTDFILQGHHHLDSSPFSTIAPSGRDAMRHFRERYMYYSYCYDVLRYPDPLPECAPVVPSEKALFKESGRLKPVFVPRMTPQRWEQRLPRRRRRGRARRTKPTVVVEPLPPAPPRPAPPEAGRYAYM